MTASMKRYGIVVGVDGSPASNFAVCWAARDAALRNVPLTLVHMVNATTVWPQVPMAAEAMAWQVEEGPRILQEAVKVAEDANRTGRKIDIESELWHAPPVPTLATHMLLAWFCSVQPVTCWEPVITVPAAAA